MQTILIFLTKRFSLVMIAALIIGLCFQNLAAIANPYIKSLLMFGIYLSLIKIDFLVLKSELKKPFLQLYILLFTNLILPIILFIIMKLACLAFNLDHQWAVAVLVLYGASTASLSPALCILMNGHFERAIINSLLSALLVPFSLPLIIRLMNGSAFKLDISAMMIDLIIMIAIPMIACAITKIFLNKYTAKATPYIAPFSVFLLAIIVLGCVDGLTSVIIKEPSKLLVGLLISFIMIALAFTLGWIFAFKGNTQDRATLAIFSAWPNAGLVIVISQIYFKQDYPIILLFAVLSEIPWNTTFGLAQKFIQYMQSRSSNYLVKE